MATPPRELALGIDIGSTKVCAALAGLGAPSRGAPRVALLGAVTVSRAALEVGTDAAHAVGAIHEAVGALERTTGVRPASAWLALGTSLRTEVTARGARGSDDAGQWRDVPAVPEADPAHRCRVAAPGSRMVMHAYERWAGGGARSPVRRPLSVETVTVSWRELRGAVGAVARAGLALEDVMLAPSALAELVLDERERRCGVALLDVGGSVSTTAVVAGSLRHAASTPLGGDFITRALAAELGVTRGEAERLKLCAAAVRPEEPLQAWTDAGERRLVSGRELVAALGHACERYCTTLRRDIDLRAAASLVLTGGGATAVGLERAASATFGLPTRLAQPPGPSLRCDARQAVAASLALLAVRRTALLAAESPWHAAAS
ncbi:MAG: hypothetical protein IT373_02335 [Polyangiaceae bacterium]|nr:hypothetical protein [Polyangiaceae bacterium]